MSFICKMKSNVIILLFAISYIAPCLAEDDFLGEELIELNLQELSEFHNVPFGKQENRDDQEDVLVCPDELLTDKESALLENALKEGEEFVDLAEAEHDQSTPNLLEKLLEDDQGELLGEDEEGKNIDPWFGIIMTNPAAFSFYMTLNQAEEIITDKESKDLLQAVLQDPKLVENEGVMQNLEVIFSWVELLVEIERAVDIIADEESKNFLQEVLVQQDLLREKETQKKISQILTKVNIIIDLKKARDLVNDEPSLELIKRVLFDQELLEDKGIFNNVINLLERVDMVLMLQGLIREVSDESKKELIQKWLENQEALSNPELRKQIKFEIAQIKKELSKKEVIKKQSRRAKKKWFIAAYTLYRKMMLVRALDSGQAPGWIQRKLNLIASAAYVGWDVFADILFPLLKTIKKSEEEREYELLKIMQQAQGLTQGAGAKVEAATGTFRRMLEDDFFDHIKKQVKRQADVVYHRMTWSDNRAQRKHQRKAFRGGIERYKEGLLTRVSQEGTRDELGFFYVFDRYLDGILERKIDTLLGKVKIPQALRKVLWKNSLVRFLREVSIFKVLPTYIYYQGKVLFGNYEDRFDTFMPFRESVKSIGLRAKHRVVGALVDKINGPGDEEGRGRLDKVKDATIGLFGPNFISMVSDLVTPYAMMSITDRFQEGFLREEHYFTDYQLGRNHRWNDLSEFAKEEVEQALRHSRIAKKVFAYAGKNVAMHCMLKLLEKYKGTVSGWFSQKVDNVLQFMVRRGWLEKDTLDDIRLGGSIAKEFIPLLFIFIQEEKLLTRFDKREIFEVVERTGDKFKFFDYLLAAWIGKVAGKKVAAWGVRKLNAAHVF